MDSFCGYRKYAFSPWVSVAHAEWWNTRNIPHPYSFTHGELPHRLLSLSNPHLYSMRNTHTSLRTMRNTHTNLPSLSNPMHTVPTVIGLL